MSRAACLYFHLPDSGVPPELLAEDHCYWEYMPSLWRLLIAQGKSGGVVTPISGEHGAPTQTIQAPARQALERLVHFNTLIAQHPLLHLNPTLPTFLDGALTFLREKLAAFKAGDQERVMVVAQLGSNDFDEDIPEVLQELDGAWNRLAAMHKNASYHELDDVLKFGRSRHGFKQWRAWSHLFGLETLSHPYFKALEYGGYWEHDEDAPATRTYQQFTQRQTPAPRDEDDGEHATLGTLFSALLRMFGAILLLPYRVIKYRLLGFKPAGARSYAPEQDIDEDHGDDESDLFDAWSHTGYIPEYVDGKVGLCALVEDGDEYRRGAQALAPDWDEISPTNYMAAWARRGDKWSLIEIAPVCVVKFAACCDEIVSYGYNNITCIVRQNGLFGAMDIYRMEWAVPPIYQAIKCDDGDDTTWRVRSNDLWGMLDGDGTEMHPCVFDSIEADIREFPYTRLGWQVVQAGRMGWITRTGEWELKCAWDAITPSLGLGLFAVARQSRWGLMARGDVPWLPCQYLSVEPVALAPHFGIPQEHHGFIEDSIWPDEKVPDFIAGHDAGQAQVLIVVSTETGTGVVDQANRTLVPCIYQSVTPPRDDKYQDSKWLCLVDRNGRQGLWDVTLGAEIFPCENDWLEVIVSPRSPAFVGTVNNLAYRLWHLDGSAAFDGAFRWVTTDSYNARKGMPKGIGWYNKREVAEAWANGEEVRAALIVEGKPDQVMLLLPGRPMRSEYDSMLQAYQQHGDVRAAVTLAGYYTDGVFQPKDAALERIWLGRACGHEAPPAGAAKAPGHQGERAEEAAEELSKLKMEACRRFATMLYDGVGGPRDPVLARTWAEKAARIEGDSGNAATRILLARMLLDPDAGQVDPVRAYKLIEDISAPSRDEGEATYYRGVIQRDGLGVERDWLAARELFSRSDAAGMAAAAPAQSALLRLMAKDAPPDEAPLLLREAAYYDKKAQFRAAHPEIDD